jgi:hypothetical protein
MTSFQLMHALIIAEPFLSGLVLWAFLRANDHKRFPAMGGYLALRVASVSVLCFLLHAHHFGIDPHVSYAAYFYAYVLSYLASAIAIFFVIQEMFKHLMAPLPGLSRLGLVAFRWAASISILVAMTSVVLPSGLKGDWVTAATSELMRCMSIMELCILAFLAFSLHSLGLSFRSRVFGVGLGFGLMASMEFVVSAFSIGHPSFATSAGTLSEITVTMALLTWTSYFLQTEPERKPVTLPVSSSLLRWNEIATALGHSTPHVAVGSSSDFFLQDVEKVVDKILTKNSVNSVS